MPELATRPEGAESLASLARAVRAKPMLPVRGVVAILNATALEVLSLIDSGKLLWAFDISLHGTGSRTREVRVLTQCVADCMRGQVSAVEWEDVIKEAVPHGGDTVATAEIQHFLNASNEHVIALGRRG